MSVADATMGAVANLMAAPSAGLVMLSEMGLLRAASVEVASEVLTVGESW